LTEKSNISDRGCIWIFSDLPTREEGKHFRTQTYSSEIKPIRIANGLSACMGWQSSKLRSSGREENLNNLGSSRRASARFHSRTFLCPQQNNGLVTKILRDSSAPVLFTRTCLSQCPCSCSCRHAQARRCRGIGG
jgi:hypothetical protein